VEKVAGLGWPTWWHHNDVTTATFFCRPKYCAEISLEISTAKKNEEEKKFRPPFHPLARVCRPPV
jgi:hypothetical protein